LLDWWTRREVVAPLSSEVVRTEQGLTTAGVNLDQVRIEQKKVLNAYQQVKLAIETEALQRRYAIDDLRRRIRVIEARLAYVGQLHADRDGEVLDLQVIAGQTVAVVQRLGTIGRVAGGGASLKAVSYFAPADARRLRNGMPVEVAPQWNQRSRFGGIVGKVLQVNTLPATEEDISTTIGNPQTGTGSLCTVRPATDGGEPEGRREPWREQRRTPEGSAPPIKGSPPPRSGPQTLLLIDERAGRAVAEAFGIRLAGAAAVIGLGRQRRLIDSAKAVFAELHATDFRIAPSALPPP
jgi:hypothetical protein